MVFLFFFEISDDSLFFLCRYQMWWCQVKQTQTQPKKRYCCGVDGQWKVIQESKLKTSHNLGEMDEPSFPLFTDTGKRLHRNI